MKIANRIPSKSTLKAVSLCLVLSASLVACSSNRTKPKPKPQPRPINNAQAYKKSQINKNQAGLINARLGILYFAKGNRKLAKQKLLQAVKQAPKSITVLDAMAYFLERTGEITEARNYYTRALDINPRSGAANNDYGTFLCRQKQPEASITYFEKAARDPTYLNSAKALENAGLCALLIPRHGLAERMFKRALMQEPTLATSAYELAKIQIYYKRYSEAKKYTEQYLRLIKEPSPTDYKLAISVAKLTKDKAMLRRYQAELRHHHTPARG